MASKEQIIGSAILAKEPKDSRVDLAWLKAEAWLKPLGLRVAKPDLDAIIARMAKAKKGMDFVASFDGQWLAVASRVGTGTESLSDIDVSDGKNDAKWRIMMQLLKDKTQLVNEADWAKFQKEHPDPAVVAAIKAQVVVLDNEIKTLQDSLKAAQDKLKVKLADRELRKKALTAMGVK
jgi:hypothetical protein